MTLGRIPLPWRPESPGRPSREPFNPGRSPKRSGVFFFYGRPLAMFPGHPDQLGSAEWYCPRWANQAKNVWHTTHNPCPLVLLTKISSVSRKMC